MNGPSVQSLLSLLLRLSDADRFEAATRQPIVSQQKKLLDIMRRNRDTEFGRAHDFGSVTSVGDFQARVPATDYDGVAPFVERVMRGEANVLTAEKPTMFATTSGTTGRTKYIPVTPSYLKEYSHAVHVHTYRLFADFPDLLEGQALVPSSNDVEGRTEAGLPYGAISGYLTKTQPAFLKRYYVLPYELCTVKDVQTKYYLTLRFALQSDVRLIITPNPSSLVLLAEKMTEFSEELIHDIRHGTINSSLVPDAARFSSKLQADPGHAAQLEALAKGDGKLLPREAWPNLRVLSCWKGGTMPLYLRKLPDLYGDVPIRDLGYMASEGRGGTPLVSSGAAGVLSVTSHFFEFLPEEQRDSPDPEFLTCDQLEPNRMYYVYFTTSGGLYRYDINDVVRVVDFYRDTPVIQFVRKGQGISSITGEKLTESQVTGALIEALDHEPLDVEHFTACVQLGEPPAYALYVEGAARVSHDRLRRFAAAIDRALCANNSEYEAKRVTQRLGAPFVKRVAPGSYQALRQQRVLAGAPEAQVKIPQLSPSLRFGEQMQVIEEIRAEGVLA
ncbi:MAG TPA: GH3 auxin-responsive promoter family protein [Chloroflexota bacterium]|nr:GH3 auxin-responsive promoter family protein [Chloroflexota bacterium]